MLLDLISESELSFDGTVVIMTTMDYGQFDIYRKEAEDDEFVQVDTTYDPSMSIVCNTRGKVAAA